METVVIIALVALALLWVAVFVARAWAAWKWATLLGTLLGRAIGRAAIRRARRRTD
jgi:hypothetical protein